MLRLGNPANQHRYLCKLLITRTHYFRHERIADPIFNNGEAAPVGAPLTVFEWPSGRTAYTYDLDIKRTINAPYTVKPQ